MAIITNIIGPFQWTHVLGSIAVDAAVAAYFIFSKKVRASLDNEYTSDNKRDADMPTFKQPAYWRDILMYYCIFAVVGHWMEAGFCWLISIGVVQGTVDFSNTELFRDWLFPYTVEGFGFVMCAVVLYPLKNLLQKKIKIHIIPLIISFCINALACTSIEFVCGLIINPTLAMWDYSNMPFNFMGQICLQNVLGFGLVSTIIVWVVYPFLQRQFYKLSKTGRMILAGIIIAFYLVLQSLYIIYIPLG